MKNKYLKYLLIVAVAGVWGTILYRIVKAADDKQLPVVQGALPVAAIPYQGAPHYFLVAEYPDPFLKSAIPEADAATVQLLPAVPPAPPPPPPVDISFVQYLGMISNTDKPKKVGLVSIHGREEMVQEGDTVMEVRIKQILPAEMKVQYKGKGFTVKKQ